MHVNATWNASAQAVGRGDKPMNVGIYSKAYSRARACIPRTVTRSRRLANLSAPGARALYPSLKAPYNCYTLPARDDSEPERLLCEMEGSSFCMRVAVVDSILLELTDPYAPQAGSWIISGLIAGGSVPQITRALSFGSVSYTLTACDVLVITGILLCVRIWRMMLMFIRITTVNSAFFIFIVFQDDSEQVSI
jgi:hypothetical protein